MGSCQWLNACRSFFACRRFSVERKHDTVIMKKNLTELVFILDRSGKLSSKFRVPFIPDANVGADDLSALWRRSFCEMQRLIAVEGYG